MAVKKGKNKSAEVTGLKSKKLSADQANQVKGGLSVSTNLTPKDMVGHKDTAASWKLIGNMDRFKY